MHFHLRTVGGNFSPSNKRIQCLLMDSNLQALLPSQPSARHLYYKAIDLCQTFSNDKEEISYNITFQWAGELTPSSLSGSACDNTPLNSFFFPRLFISALKKLTMQLGIQEGKKHFKQRWLGVCDVLAVKSSHLEGKCFPRVRVDL